MITAKINVKECFYVCLTPALHDVYMHDVNFLHPACKKFIRWCKPSDNND